MELSLVLRNICVFPNSFPFLHNCCVLGVCCRFFLWKILEKKRKSGPRSGGTDLMIVGRFYYNYIRTSYLVLIG